MIPNEVFIVGACRTPIGSFGGVLAEILAVDLGAASIGGVLEKTGVQPDWIQEVLMGNVVSANLGQAPARQAAIKAGIPHKVPCTTINKVCASGMKAAILGAQSIQLGQLDLVIAGGMESMSGAPFYVEKGRFGYKYGHATLVDGLIRDGLEDVYDQCTMGTFADRTAQRYQISREAQDDFAIRSYRLSASSAEQGKFSREIVPVKVSQKKGADLLIETDEEYLKVNFEKIPGLKPAFTAGGTVTAANASTINDGASAMILASAKALKTYQLKPLARIVSYADAAQDPAWFTTAPVLAVPRALERAGLSKDDIDFIEVNEAFAVVPLVFSQMMEVELAKINVYGGAVSLGHPLGASGARIMTTLLNVMQSEGGKYGLATICNGGGGASAIVLEKM